MSFIRPIATRTRFLTFARPLCLRYSSTTTSEPVILPRLQSDLKAALRAKNKPALNTIRSLQAEIINASKTAKPIETDGALYSLIQKQIKGITTAIEEFQAAKRDDLVQKEQEQLNVLQRYLEEIPKVEDSEVDGMVESAVKALEGTKANFGQIMGKVMAAVAGRPANVEYIRQKVNEAVGQK